jgi:hypothetical protein
MAHENDERDEDERDDADHEEHDDGHGEHDDDAHEHAAPAAARKPAPTFPADALHTSFEQAHTADLDAVPQREASMWFTYTMIGIAVYGAVVIYWIYL